MGNAFLWIALAIAFVLVWAPVVIDLADEFASHSPVSSRRRQRQARRAAEEARSHVRDRPEVSSRHGGSPGAHRAPVRTRRDMPPAGTWRMTVPAGGPDTRHRGPVCG